MNALRAAVWSLRALALLLVAGAAWSLWVWERDPVRVAFVYSPDAADLVAKPGDDLVARFNAGDHAIGMPRRRVVVEATPLASGDAQAQIRDGKPVDLWLPASQYWAETSGRVSRAEWNRAPLVVSPLVLVQPSGAGSASPPTTWQELFDRVQQRRLLFGHTNPDYSTSGLFDLAAELRWAARREPTVDDIHDPAVLARVADLETRVVHYADTGNEFLDQLGRWGSQYAGGAVVQENSLRRYNATNPSRPLVGSLPQDGTYLARYPLVVVRSPGASGQQAQAARDLRAYIEDHVDDRLIAEAGFRRDTSGLASTVQPETRVLTGALADWPYVRKHADVGIVVDPACATTGRLHSYVAGMLDRMSPDDRVGLWVAGSAPVPVGLLATNRNRLIDALRVQAASGVSYPWYDALARAFDNIAWLRTISGPSRMAGVILISSGKDSGSATELSDLWRHIETAGGGDRPDRVRVFSVACTGARTVLDDLARASKGDVFGLVKDDPGKAYRRMGYYW